MARTKKKPDYSFKLFARDVKDFVEYPQCGERDAFAICFTSMKVSEAVGRVADHVTTAIEEDKLGQQDRRLGAGRRDDVRLAIGDTLSWLTRLAHESGLTIEECAEGWSYDNEDLFRRAATVLEDDRAKTIMKRRRSRK
jgi:hypothetical protein